MGTVELYTFLATLLTIAIIGVLIYFACKARARTLEKMREKEKPLPRNKAEK